MTLPREDPGLARAKGPIFFDAEMLPHRSLGPRGFNILMIGVALVSVASGIAFCLKGAWPVPGFCGLDVLLLYLAFRANYRRARFGESIRLDSEGLTVRRRLPGGRVQMWQFEPYWVRVQMDDPPRRESQLALSSHGRKLVLGTFLSPDERLEVANALRDALAARARAMNSALI